MTRLDPFELVFGDHDDEIDALAAALSGPRTVGTDLGAFAAHPAVRALLARLEPAELLETQPAASGEYLLWIYVAAAYARAGHRVLVPDRDRLHAAMAGILPQTPVPVPDGACYIRFPERWLWSQVQPDAPHEPIDGVFAVDGPGTGNVTALAVLGLRPERAGFSQISVTIRRSDVSAAAAAVRPDRFAPAMDGGRAAGFRSIVSPAELLVVTQLALVETSR